MSSETTESTESVLHELLNQHRAGELEEYNVAANHAPMVLIALCRMGAGPDQLRRYFASVETGRPASSSDPLNSVQIDRHSWTKYLGRFDAWSSYHSFFQTEIAMHGAQKVLTSYVTPLMRGVAAHAFHPLLRLGYGIDLNDEDEIASGLGYWASTYLPAPEVPGSRGRIEPLQLLTAMENSESLRRVRPETDSITLRIKQFYEDEEFGRLLRPIDLEAERPLDAIAVAIAEGFGRQHHFTMLHGVTSCHALRMILPYCENRKDALNSYWYSICASYLSVINLWSGPLHPLPDGDGDWSRIQADAVATGVEHTIKLAYTCLKESEEYQTTIYRGLAIREIDIPAPFV